MEDVPCLEVGERLGNSYVVRGELARRGTRRVYAADDLVLGRRVAIEVCAVREGAQLLREAKALAAVRHPGVPVVYGVGLADTVSYVVLERVHGVSLASVMAEHRTLHVSEIVPVLISLADAIAAVHGAGLVPASVTPATVMLCGPDRIVLLGVREATAIALPDRRAEDTRAFGALAYELFIGSPPEPAGDDGDNGGDIAALRPDVPAALADLVASCLATSPDQRPPMTVVAEELRAIPLRRRARSTIAPGASAHRV